MPIFYIFLLICELNLAYLSFNHCAYAADPVHGSHANVQPQVPSPSPHDCNSPKDQIEQDLCTMINAPKTPTPPSPPIFQDQEE